MPSLMPSAESHLDKPDESTYCPASGKKLRMKDLVPVRFTPVPEGESGLHMDPVTKDTFTNTSKLVVLRPTGDVMLKETYDKCIKPEGQYKGGGRYGGGGGSIGCGGVGGTRVWGGSKRVGEGQYKDWLVLLRWRGLGGLGG